MGLVVVVVMAIHVVRYALIIPELIAVIQFVLTNVWIIMIDYGVC